MDIPLMSGAYAGFSANINAQVCENLMPLIDKEENVPVFYGRPGLSSLSEVYADNPVRGMEQMGGNLWIAVGDRLYKRTTGGSNTNKGTLDTSSGYVHFAAGAGDKMLIVDGTSGYTIVSDTFAKITDVDFPTPTSCCYIDGFYVVSEADTGKFWISGLDDPTSWGATDYSSAEGSPDNLKCVINNQNDLWLLGDHSLEIWFDSGNATFPFERITGAIGHIGTNSPNSAAVYNRTLYFLDEFGIVRASRGLDPQRISTSQIEYNFRQYSTLADAVGYMIPFEGYELYVLTFPTDDATWVYNISMGLWCTWTSYANRARFRGTCYELFNNVPIVGDHTNGKIYTLSSSEYQDNATAVDRNITTRNISSGGYYLLHRNLKIEMETGHGQLAVTIMWSVDGGESWSNALQKVISNEDYTGLVQYDRLGRSKNRIYAITVTGNSKTVIKGIAHSDIGRTTRI